MNIHRQLSSQELQKAFDVLRNNLKGADGVIFQAMGNIAPELGIDFAPPQNEQEYQQKYSEISRRFSDRGARLLRGSDVCLMLIEETYSLVTNSQIGGLNPDQVLQGIYFTVKKPEAILQFSENKIWQLVFNLEMGKLIVFLGKQQLQIIVPDHILQYLSSAITSFKQANHLATGALLSIALEGTLRDILLKAGYEYYGVDRPYDIYSITSAHIGRHEDKYTVRFSEQMPKSINDFDSLLNGNEELEVRIRRTEKRRNREDVFDLTVINPDGLIDFWSVDHIEQEKKDSIAGLGKALQVARRENLITVDELPLDIDETIMAIRNHLVHLSENSLQIIIPYHNIPLVNFLDDGEMVLDLLAYVINFINQQYFKLTDLRSEFS
jgi:hypothetical protein